MGRMATSPPWKRKNPKRTHTKLTAKSKAAARARARRAGRPYPSLVDNMNAAKQQKAAGTKTPKKRLAAKTRPAAKRATTKRPAAKTRPAAKRATRTAAR